MKKFLLIFTLLACILSLILGNIYWKDRIKQADTKTSSFTEPEMEIEKTSSNELLGYAENWPDKSKELFKERLKDQKPFHILIAGSTSLDNKSFHLAEKIKTNLKKVYGDSVKVSGLSYDMTSTEFVKQNKQQELINAKADMIIFEPFTLKDNGTNAANESLFNLSTIIKDVTKANNETVFVLQPPNPLVSAVYYPVEISNLQAYAKEQNILYLDHWKNWPKSNTEELKQYFKEDFRTPNEKGYTLWETYIEDFLIK